VWQEMNPRERIEKTLKHEEPDRVPVDFGGTFQSGIHVSVVNKLREYYGLSNKVPVKVVEPFQMLGEIADDLKVLLGVDCIGISSKSNQFGFENSNWKRWKLFDGTDVLVPGKFNTKQEKDGSILQYPEGDTSVGACACMPRNGYYFDLIQRQESIDESNLNINDNLEEFKIIKDEDLEYLGKKADFLFNNTDYAIIGDFGGTSFCDMVHIQGSALKNPKGIRNVEDWYISLITRKNYILDIFNVQCETGIKNLGKIYDAVGNKISIISTTAADFGTQNGPFIGLGTYKELIKPFHKKLNDWIHNNTNWEVFIHSCGAIEPLIPEFIEAGFDILNPIQCTAYGMEPKALKKKYGKDIILWGGGVDTQTTLAFGTGEEVKNEVLERLEIFGKGGGYVFNAVHNIQVDVPIENFITMINTVKEYRILTKD